MEGQTVIRTIRDREEEDAYGYEVAVRNLYGQLVGANNEANNVSNPAEKVIKERDYWIIGIRFHELITQVFGFLRNHSAPADRERIGETEKELGKMPFKTLFIAEYYRNFCLDCLYNFRAYVDDPEMILELMKFIDLEVD